MKAQYGVETLFLVGVVLISTLLFSTLFLKDFEVKKQNHDLKYLSEECVRFKSSLLSVYLQEDTRTNLSFSTDLNLSINSNFYSLDLNRGEINYYCKLFSNNLLNSSLDAAFNFFDTSLVNFEKSGGVVILRKLS